MPNPPKRLSLTIPAETVAIYRSMAKARGMTLNAVICSTLFDALPKPSTAKTLSVREEKAAHHAVVKGRFIAHFREEIRKGWTREQVHASAKACPQFDAWYAEALALEQEPMAMPGWEDLHDDSTDTEGE